MVTDAPARSPKPVVPRGVRPLEARLAALRASKSPGCGCGHAHTDDDAHKPSDAPTGGI